MIVGFEDNGDVRVGKRLIADRDQALALLKDKASQTRGFTVYYGGASGFASQALLSEEQKFFNGMKAVLRETGGRLFFEHETTLIHPLGYREISLSDGNR